MSSPFKMAPKTPFMKALVGKQGNLPQHLKQAILDAPAKKDTDPKKKKDDFRYESDAPEVIGTAYTKGGTERVTEYKKGGKDIKKGDTYERGGFQTPKKVVDTGRDASGRKKAGRTGTVDVEVKKGDVRFSTGKKTKKKGSTSKSPAKSYGKSPVKKKELSPSEQKAVSDYRRGAGRVDVTKKGKVVKGSETRKLGTGMGPAGTKKAGSAGSRYAGKGQPGSPKQLVVREKTASKIKKRGVKKTNIKASAGKSPAKMKGVKALKKK